MALQYCQSCTTSYALGLEACPHCQHPTTTTVTGPASTIAEGDQTVRDAVRQGVRRSRKEPPPEAEAVGADA